MQQQAVVDGLTISTGRKMLCFSLAVAGAERIAPGIVVVPCVGGQGIGLGWCSLHVFNEKAAIGVFVFDPGAGAWTRGTGVRLYGIEVNGVGDGVTGGHAVPGFSRAFVWVEVQQNEERTEQDEHEIDGGPEEPHAGMEKQRGQRLRQQFLIGSDCSFCLEVVFCGTGHDAQLLLFYVHCFYVLYTLSGLQYYNWSDRFTVFLADFHKSLL